MAIHPVLSNFIKNESGLVTVDWVVLTCGLCALGIATQNVVGAGMADMVDEINTQLRSDFVIQRSFVDPNQNSVVENPNSDGTWTGEDGTTTTGGSGCTTTSQGYNASTGTCA